jgi:3-methyladenine DNA glycosylase AlkD
MTLSNVLNKLKQHKDPKNAQGMARFGIKPQNAYGIKIPILRKMAKEIGKNHKLAQDLWSSGIHEAKILAGMIDELNLVTQEQMDNWIKDFDSWDVCDQVCMNLFDKTDCAFDKAKEWASKRDREFEKRAGFALMAALAFHDKKNQDKDFIAFFPYIKAASKDDRNYVKKAVNWALRQIGKRNKNLCKAAIKLAEEIEKMDSKSAKWIAKDALRELRQK